MRKQQNGRKAHHNVRRQSVYIAALDRYLDIQGLIYPYQDRLGYNFDFYAPTHRRLIKIFTHIDDAEIARYLDHPRRKNTIFIIDITPLMKNPLAALLGHKLPKPIEDAAIKLDATLFITNRLYRLCKAPDGSAWWQPYPEPYNKGFEDGREEGYKHGYLSAAIEAPFKKEATPQLEDGTDGGTGKESTAIRLVMCK